MKRLMSMTLIFIILNSMFFGGIACSGFSADPDGSLPNVESGDCADSAMVYMDEDFRTAPSGEERAAPGFLAYDSAIGADGSGAPARDGAADTASGGEGSKAGDAVKKRKSINLVISLLLTTLVLAGLSVFPIIMVSRAMQKNKPRDKASRREPSDQRRE